MRVAWLLIWGCIMTFELAGLVEQATGAEAGETVFEVKTEPAETTVDLGASTTLTVTVTNVSDTEQKGPELVFDARSVSLQVAGGGAEGYYTRMGEENHQPAPIQEVTWKAGEAKTLEIPFPTVAPGAWTLKGIYRYAEEEAAVGPGTTLTVGGEGKTLHCRIETNRGAMVAELRPDLAVNTVLHFARRVQEGGYDGNVFHRVIEGFMLQGGDPDGTGMGGPGYVLPAEFNAEPHEPGTLSMARRADPDSAGCQFFVCHKRVPHLDRQYTVFGKVVEGLDVVDTIAATKTGRNDRPAEDQVMKTLTLEAK